MAAERKTISPEALTELIVALFMRKGVAEDQARTAAEVFVWANLRGVDSHGVSRVPRYLEMFDSGEANPKPAITIETLRPSVLLMNADRAPGPVALTQAADAAVAVAKQTGICWISVKGAVHTGAIGYYVERMAKSGCAAIAMVAGMPNMGYAGVKGAAVATSPLAIAVPSARHGVVVLDMATATIALGRIAQHRARGLALPEGAALTKEGMPTTDPALAAIPTPMAGAKGGGMSLMFEILTSVLSGAAAIMAPFHTGAPGGRKHRQNAAFIVVDLSAFRDVEGVRGGCRRHP